MPSDIELSTKTVVCSAAAHRYHPDNPIGTSIESAREACVEALGGACGIRVIQTSHQGPDKNDTVFTVKCTEVKEMACGDRILDLLKRMKEAFPYEGA